jgi:hypothetical protein
MDAITPALLDRLSLTEIDRITFFKRDELTTDLLCCDVQRNGQNWFFHEEMPGWDLLLDHLKGLPGFREDWFATVSQPAFVSAETIAFRRS